MHINGQQDLYEAFKSRMPSSQLLLLTIYHTDANLVAQHLGYHDINQAAAFALSDQKFEFHVCHLVLTGDSALSPLGLQTVVAGHPSPATQGSKKNSNKKKPAPELLVAGSSAQQPPIADGSNRPKKL